MRFFSECCVTTALFACIILCACANWCFKNFVPIKIDVIFLSEHDGVLFISIKFYSHAKNANFESMYRKKFDFIANNESYY